MKTKTKVISLIAVLTLCVCFVGTASVIKNKNDSKTEPTENSWDSSFISQKNIDESERAPYGIKIMSVSDRGNQVYWKNLEGISGYELYRCYEKHGEYELVTDFTDLSKRSFFDTEFDHLKQSVYYKVIGYFIQEDGSRRYTPFSKIKVAKYRQEPELSEKKIYIASETTHRIEAFIGWGNIESPVWISENDSIATVDENGVITGVSQGKCNIVCSGEGLTAPLSCQVIVDRQADDVMEPVVSRYVRSDDGTWYAPGAKKTDDAVIMMAGDMMCMGNQQKACRLEDGSYDFNKTYSYMRNFILTSDFAIGNLETAVDSSFPYSCDASYTDGMPNCNAPSRYIEAIRYGGFDGVVTANNHTADAGVHGVKETLLQVEKYKLAHTGSFSDGEESRTLLVNVNSIKVGFLAYATGYNSKDTAWEQNDVDTLLNYYEKDKALKDIEELKCRGAEYIIVYMHWGTKNNYNYSEKQAKMANELADMGVDYIVGSHPHLIQTYVTVKASDGKTVPCVYSLGDFNASLDQVPGNLDSVLLRIRLKRTENGTVELAENAYVPFTTYREFDGIEYPTLPLNSKLNGGFKPEKYDELRERIEGWIGDEIKEYEAQ